jgi:hypothetical protein
MPNITEPPMMSEVCITSPGALESLAGVGGLVPRLSLFERVGVAATRRGYPVVTRLHLSGIAHVWGPLIPKERASSRPPDLPRRPNVSTEGAFTAVWVTAQHRIGEPSIRRLVTQSSRLESRRSELGCSHVLVQ